MFPYFFNPLVVPNYPPIAKYKHDVVATSHNYNNDKDINNSSSLGDPFQLLTFVVNITFHYVR